MSSCVSSHSCCRSANTWTACAHLNPSTQPRQIHRPMFRVVKRCTDQLDRAADAIVALDRAEEGGVLRLGDGLLGRGLGLRLRLLRLLPLRRHRGYSLLGGWAGVHTRRRRSQAIGPKAEPRLSIFSLCLLESHCPWHRKTAPIYIDDPIGSRVTKLTG